MADGAGDELALTGQTGGANTTPEAASEQQIMLLQLRLKIAEAERERQRMELEIQRLQSHRSAEPGDVDSSFAVGAKADEDRRLKFAGLLKGILALMPSQEAFVPSWFEDVEATLESYDVPREWWAGLVLPRLSERAREFKQLTVADRLRECLTAEARAHVILNEKPGFLRPSEVVKLAESYDESRKNRPVVVSSTGAPVANLTTGEAVASSQAKKANWDARIRKQCFKCHASGHIAKQAQTGQSLPGVKNGTFGNLLPSFNAAETSPKTSPDVFRTDAHLSKAAQNVSQRVRDVNGTCVCVRVERPGLTAENLGYDSFLTTSRRTQLQSTWLSHLLPWRREREKTDPYIRRGPGSSRTCGLSPASNNWLAAVGIGPCDIVLHLRVSVWTLLWDSPGFGLWVINFELLGILSV
ncbi:hypothetical protein HPB47_014553 [Ixodes persulcatus]|uniref:Uncharacterized protein n=1 Tax=Ixodes persulcatus TaxID=34615 RepID=A0AC60QX35_IXOPE|nr:hypothetical protein HPB47_014553 [Ixodes persulcatus]